MGYTHFDGLDPTNFKINGTEVTATASELNILDGVTADASELNTLDGVTSSTAELNILDGVTSSTAELNILDGVTADKDDINILPNMLADVTFSVGTASGGTITVGCQMVDAGGDDLSALYVLPMYLADDDAGGTPTAATPGTLAAGSTGAIMETIADQAFFGVTDTSGSLDVNVVEDGSDSWYAVAVLPTGRIAISDIIDFT